MGDARGPEVAVGVAETGTLLRRVTEDRVEGAPEDHECVRDEREEPLNGAPEGPRWAMTDQPAHDEAEVERRCLHEVALLHVLASAEPRSSMAAGLAEMSEGAFEKLAPSSLHALALARLEAQAGFG
jgi:hypothetical protein